MPQYLFAVLDGPLGLPVTGMRLIRRKTEQFVKFGIRLDQLNRLKADTLIGIKIQENDKASK